MFAPEDPESEAGSIRWRPFNARLNSSTRCELRATLLVLVAPVVTHLGVDNAAVVLKGVQIIRHLLRRNNEASFTEDGTKILGGRTSSLDKPSPFKERWALVKHGDLWQTFAKMVVDRGPQTVAISKVKGHGTDDMVQAGEVRRSDKRGNGRVIRRPV